MRKSHFESKPKIIDKRLSSILTPDKIIYSLSTLGPDYRGNFNKILPGQFTETISFLHSLFRYN